MGEDEWGDWIGVPAGARRWKGERVVRDTRTAAVFCAPREGWWHLHYGGKSDFSDYRLFIDIVTPPVWVSPNRYEMIDLDLDVGVTLGGDVVIEDEDEFEIHQVEFAYTEEMITRARSETDRIVRALEARHEPFFEVAAGWLSRVDDSV